MRLDLSLPLILFEEEDRDGLIVPVGSSFPVGNSALFLFWGNGLSLALTLALLLSGAEVILEELDND